ncbi:hypothetical protein MMC13_006180 [Lambiella insularis]|nr:hypothetical protein [Lambiella insularis]
MASEDGENFVKNLAQFVRTHEKALANALQLRHQGGVPKLAISGNGETPPTQITPFQSSTITSSTSNALAAAFSLGALSFTSHNIKPAKLTLTPHHLFYLLSRFEELGIVVGPMNVRLESLHTEQSPANYVSFLSRPQGSKGRSDRDSVHSVSSVRSAMSGISSLWTNWGISLSGSAAKTEKAKAQLEADIKYLYSAFTKIPCLRLSPDRKARLIAGFEEYPFDTAVPLFSFKNVTALEIYDVDFRQFFGWDRLADQLRSLTVKRALVDDLADLLIGVVLDDMDKRRRRSSKSQSSPLSAWPMSLGVRHPEFAQANSAPGSPVLLDDKSGPSSSPRNNRHIRGGAETANPHAHTRTKSSSPTRPTSSRQSTSHRQHRGSGAKVKRSGSGSSNSSTRSMSSPARNRSSSNLITMNMLPASKWRFLKHLSLADNSLTSLTTSSLLPLANTLHSLDLSSNLFSEVPDSLASLTALRALNLSNCMIESLHSLARNPLPAINALNLRSNRLASLAGIERLPSLERLDLRDNRLSDPTETARLTGTPDIREIWVLNNPFVKSHINYRITILNLFRGTPGYTEDILIDATSPGFSERRQLRERITETEAVPIVKPVDVARDTVPFIDLDVSTSHTANPFDERLPRPRPRMTQSEANISSGRRKRAVKRRIVDLSVDEMHPGNTAGDPSSGSQLRSTRVVVADVNQTAVATPHETSSEIQSGSPYQGDDTVTSLPQLAPNIHSKPMTVKVPPNPPDVQLHADSGRLLADQLHGQHINGEAYRRKVEALKDEFGNAWLNVLSHEKWEGHRLEQERPSSPFIPASPVRPDNIPNLRATSIMSGSRTLG